MSNVIQLKHTEWCWSLIIVAFVLNCIGIFTILDIQADEPTETDYTQTSRQYPAKVINIVDADTFDIDVDLGFGLRLIRRFRIAAYDAPEIFSPKTAAEKSLGIRATNEAKKLLYLKPIEIISEGKLGKYGRLVCSIRLPNGMDYATYMIGNGYIKTP